jgi:hypothetical protein
MMQAYWGMLADIAGEVWQLIKDFFADTFGRTDVFAGWGNAVQRVFLTLEYVFKNWRTMVMQGVNEIKLAFLEWWNQVKHYAEHWQELITGQNLPARQQTQEERDLRQLVEAGRSQISQGLDAFIQSRMKQLDETIARTRTQLDDIPKKYSTYAGAAEMGSKEAFSIIAGDKGDKAYRVATDQLRVQRAMLEALQNQRQGGALQPANL